jgi:death-on-curing protein
VRFLTTADVVRIHESVINPHELQGLAADKSIDAVVARIENRMNYGLITDVFDLAACYAICIGVAHAFNDANKRTAFAAMDTVLALNGIELSFSEEEAGDMVRAAVLGRADEKDMAAWLRKLAA